MQQPTSSATAPARRVVAAPDFSGLELLQLLAMQRAGLEILECYRVLQKAGLNIVGEVLRDALNRGETFYEFNHYPADDVYDRETHAQYYYHAHRGESGEHGHFHTFLRPQGMPAGVAPIEHPASEPWPHHQHVTGEDSRLREVVRGGHSRTKGLHPTVSWPQGDEALSHLVAIAMDDHGYPTGLFTTNRWVTAEAWYPADQVIRMLDRFVIDHAFPSWPVNRWISAMFLLFRPHIEALLRQRDDTVCAWAAAHPGEDMFEDRALDVTSQIAISVEETLALVEQAIEARRA